MSRAAEDDTLYPYVIFGACVIAVAGQFGHVWLGVLAVICLAAFPLLPWVAVGLLWLAGLVVGLLLLPFVLLRAAWSRPARP